MSLTKPIANWQAKFGWFCAMWGLVPVLGLALGAIALTFGAMGWLRVRMRPDDLGIRHAIGSVLLGSIELATNIVGIGLIVKGVLQLTQ